MKLLLTQVVSSLEMVMAVERRFGQVFLSFRKLDCVQLSFHTNFGFTSQALEINIFMVMI